MQVDEETMNNSTNSFRVIAQKGSPTTLKMELYITRWDKRKRLPLMYSFVVVRIETSQQWNLHNPQTPKQKKQTIAMTNVTIFSAFVTKTNGPCFTATNTKNKRKESGLPH
jgi:hypothetical protein